jgi:hypothetical protein
MDRVTVADPVPESAMLAGLKPHVAPVGSPEQEKVTGPLKPLEPVSVSMSVPLWPAVMLSEFDCEVTAKSGLPAPGDADAVLAEDDLPEPAVDEGIARGVLYLAKQAEGFGIVDVDDAVAEVADEDVSTEAAEACGREGHAPGSVQASLAERALQEVAVVIEDVDVAEAGSEDFAAGGAHLRIVDVYLAADAVDAEGRVPLGRHHSDGEGVRELLEAFVVRQDAV